MSFHDNEPLHAKSCPQSPWSLSPGTISTEPCTCSLKEEQYAPLVGDRTVKQMQDSYEFIFSGHEELNSEAWLIGALDMRKVYEAKITSGELRVCKPVTATWCHIRGVNCYVCDNCNELYVNPGEICKGCGNPITKE